MSQRDKLPQRRRSETYRAVVDGHKLYLTVGFYDDGRVGEVFFTNNKLGSMGRSYMEGFGIAASLALQFGCPLSTLVSSLSGQPEGPLKFVVDTLKENYLETVQ